MRFVSLFSGVGGFDLGLEAAGWKCVAQVEWDKDCQAVLAHHWPDVPRWSDVSDVNGADLPTAEVVAFGSPCQDLSVAGQRRGFDGTRSVLFYEATRIIREMRAATDDTYPELVVWENVGGALSSSGGRDFAAVLDELADCGAVDIAWRVLDARWFGVPQRRRRVFVVADFAGERAGQIHAEPEGVCWHPVTRQQAGQGAPGGAGAGVDGNSPNLNTHTHTHTLRHSQVGELEPVELTTTKPKPVTSYQSGTFQRTEIAPSLDLGAGAGPRRNQSSLVVVHD